MEKIKTPEEKRADFIEKAKANKTRFNLHRSLIAKHSMNPDDLTLLKLISYAEDYHNSFNISDEEIRKIFYTKEDKDGIGWEIEVSAAKKLRAQIFKT